MDFPARTDLVTQFRSSDNNDVVSEIRYEMLMQVH